MEKKIDIIPFLEGIVEENTRHYQEDFARDEKRLQAAMLEMYQEDRTFLWMSRPCGTWCLLEREVFLRETPAHIIWTNRDYEAEADKIKAYRVIVAPGRKGAFVLGKAQPLNYGEQIQRVRQSAVHVWTVSLTFADGFFSTFSYEQYSRQSRSLIEAHGKIEHIQFNPQNESELRCILQAERMIPAVRKRTLRKKKPATR